MRTIKFRVWDGKKMIYPTEIKDYANCKLAVSYPKEYTSEGLYIPRNDRKSWFLQFTGLKDNNGKDVYEGDLLSDGEKDPMILPVIYSDEYAMFCVDISYNKDGGAIEEILTCYEDGFTVIGNIYENPELVK